MTESEQRRHLRAALALTHDGPRGTPTEHLVLLLPEGMPHEPELLEHAARLGCNYVCTPHPTHGTTPLHQAAAEAGHDVSVPVLYRPPVPKVLPALSWWRRLWSRLEVWWLLRRR